MLKPLGLLLFIVCASVPASARPYVWVDGEADGIAGRTSYSHFIQDQNTSVADDKALHSGNHSNAALGSSSSIGTLKAYARADTPFFNLVGETRVWARSQYADVITVVGAGPVTLLFTMPTTGTFSAGSYNALGSASLSITTVSADLLDLAYRARMTNGTSAVEINLTSGQITVAAGMQISLAGYLVTDARVINQNPNALMSGVDFSHTSESFIQVLTPGAGIVSQSGHSYAAPIPEPATFVLMVAGLGILGFAARRSRSAGSP